MNIKKELFSTINQLLQLTDMPQLPATLITHWPKPQSKPRIELPAH